MKKRIPIQELRPGMYIAGLDQSWFKTPFLRHKWRVKRDDEINLLKSYGIQEVLIDTEYGVDVTTEPSPESGGFPPDSSVLPGNADPSRNGPDPQEIDSARILRAEAISTLDFFFQADGDSGPPASGRSPGGGEHVA